MRSVVVVSAWRTTRALATCMGALHTLRRTVRAYSYRRADGQRGGPARVPGSSARGARRVSVHAAGGAVRRAHAQLPRLHAAARAHALTSLHARLARQREHNNRSLRKLTIDAN